MNPNARSPKTTHDVRGFLAVFDDKCPQKMTVPGNLGAAAPINYYFGILRRPAGHPQQALKSAGALPAKICP